MSLSKSKLLLAFLTVGCLSWAAYEARGVKFRSSGPGPCTAAYTPPPIVEAAFADALEAKKAGRREEALLMLQKRAEKGPYNGFALFLLGEMAYEEGAYAPALRHYRKAVELYPSVTDKVSAFDSSKVLDKRLKDLRAGPWANKDASELKDFFYIQRRLAGGCE